jgi:hypothetical protein
MSPNPWSRAALALVVAAAMGASLLVVSCGASKESTTPKATPTRTSGNKPNVITESELNHSPQGSPSRALLEFVQAVQFQDLAGAQDAFTPAVVKRVGAKRLRAAAKAVGSQFGRPQIVSTQPAGTGSVRLRVLLISYDPQGRPSLSVPITFTLRRLDGVWKLADATYLLDTYRDLQAVAGAAGRAPHAHR